MHIRLCFAEHMPDRNQQFSRNHDDGLIGFAHAAQVIFVLLLPIRGHPYGTPCRFHHDPAQLLATLFGDAFLYVRLAAIVDARTQPRVSDQMFRVFKA